MKTIARQAAQGDVLFRRVDHIPDGTKEQLRKAGDPLIVAHSETGHHHVVEAADARLIETGDPLVAYLVAEGAYADVVHKRSFDTHAPIRLEGGGAIWEIRRQREHTPEGWRRVED